METKKCPHCSKTVLAISKVCKHCGKSFEENKIVQEKTIEEVATQTQASQPIVVEQQKYIAQQNVYVPQQAKTNSRKKVKWWLWVIAVVLLFISLPIGILSLIGLTIYAVYLKKNG